MTEAKQPPQWFADLARLCETMARRLGGDENMRFALFMFTPCHGCGGANDVMIGTDAEAENLARILMIEAQRIMEFADANFSLDDVFKTHTKERCQ